MPARGGYLATLMSSAEDAFVFGLVDQPQYWNQEPAGNDLPDVISQLNTQVIAYVVEYDCPAGVGEQPGAANAMLRCAPNPLLGSTLIPFAMARPGRARLTVVDAQGRRLRELVLADLAERVAAGHEPRD